MLVINVDIRTVILLLMLGNATLAILYWLYFRSSGVETFAGDKLWLAAKGLQTLAWLLIVMRDLISEFISVAVANSLLFMGFSGECLALLLLSKAIDRMLLLYYAALTATGSLFFCFYYDSPASIRIVVASVIIAMLYFPPGLRLLLDSASSMMRRGVGILYILISTVITMRAVSALDIGSQLNLWTQSAAQTMTFVIVFLTMMTSGIGFLLISRENIDLALIKESRTDYLTGLPNRRAFFSGADKQFANCAKKQQTLSYLVIDIDQFKAINDEFGHEGGDRVLCSFSEMLTEAVRSSDLPVRLGGDEFGVLLPVTEYSDAMVVADRIQRQPHFVSVKGSSINYTVSIGVCVAPSDEIQNVSLEDLMTCGDRALYRAKALGRNRIEYERCKRIMDSSGIAEPMRI